MRKLSLAFAFMLFAAGTGFAGEVAEELVFVPKEIGREEIAMALLKSLSVEIGLPLDSFTSGGSLGGKISKRVDDWYLDANLERWDRTGNAARSGTAELGKYFLPSIYGAIWADLRENEPRGLLWASQTILLGGIDLGGGNYVEIGVGNNRVSRVTKQTIKVLEREAVLYAGVNAVWESFGATGEVTIVPEDGKALGVGKLYYVYPVSQFVSMKIVETIDFVDGASQKSIGISLVLKQ